jgi:hypothetical protein
MKKCIFQQFLRASVSMTSWLRHDLRIAIDHRHKKNMVAEGAWLVGTPTSQAPSAPVRGMPSHLQSIDEHAPFGPSPQGSVDVLPEEVQRREVVPEGGGLTVRDQHENRRSRETPVSVHARLFGGLEGKRHRRNRQNLVSEIQQGTTGRAPETSPNTWRPGSKTKALLGTVSYPCEMGKVGRAPS